MIRAVLHRENAVTDYIKGCPNSWSTPNNILELGLSCAIFRGSRLECSALAVPVDFPMAHTIIGMYSSDLAALKKLKKCRLNDYSELKNELYDFIELSNKKFTLP